MTDPEREHFARQVADLEGRLRRWQLISFVLAAVLLVPVVGVPLVAGIVFPRMQAERYRALAAEEQARDAEMRAREQAEQAVREFEKARQEGFEKPADLPREKD
jgi:hypothetical protein